MEPSKLCWADKLSITFEPKWFYLLRARLSGELKEYRLKAHESGFIDLTKSDIQWFDWVSGYLSKQAFGHKRTVKPIYLESEEVLMEDLQALARISESS